MRLDAGRKVRNGSKNNDFVTKTPRRGAGRALAELLELRRLFAVLTVNTRLDDTHADSSLTLREAIEVVNGDTVSSTLTTAEQAQINTTQQLLGTKDTIEFNIPGSGVEDIVVNGNFPLITVPMTIDGYSQPGAAPATDSSKATILIELDGVVISGADGLDIGTNNVTVRGLSIVGFDTNGIDIDGAAGDDVIVGNYIGVLPDGVTADPNTTGISIQHAPVSTIGGTTPADRNVISGNTEAGLRVNVASDGDIIEGNYVGVDATGEAALPNMEIGISVYNAQNITIGGTSSGARNVISGNSSDGLQFIAPNGGSVQNNVGQGNYVGLDAAGRGAVPNGGVGISVLGGSTATQMTIGGTTPGEGNVVAGNGEEGILLGGASGNIVQGNFVGVNALGTAVVGNQIGISIDSGVNNQIGGETPARATSLTAARIRASNSPRAATTPWREIELESWRMGQPRPEIAGTAFISCIVRAITSSAD